MTEKQRNLVLFLDIKCKEQGIKTRASDEELLGADWFAHWKNFTPQYAGEVINKLKTALGMPITTKKERKKK